MKTRIIRLVALLLLTTGTSLMAADPVKITYKGKIKIQTLQADLPYVLNRKYATRRIPKELRLKSVTVMDGNARSPIKASIPANTTLHICIDSARGTKGGDGIDEYVAKLKADGWKRVGRISTTDKRMQYLNVFSKHFDKAADVTFLGIGFPGVMIVADSLELTK